jgi:cytochrome c
MYKVLLTIAVLLVPGQALALDGKDEFKRNCGICHSIEQDSSIKKLGPNLWNIMNRGVGTSVAEDNSAFPALSVLGGSGAYNRYSKEFSAWAHENPQWTEELLDAWLTNSKKLVKGTNMSYRQKSAEKRGAIIEYLKSMGEK